MPYDALAPRSSLHAPRDEFRQQAELPPKGFLGELLYMVRHDKKWWLVPILLMLVVLSALVFLGGTAAAPFIYTLF